MLFRIVSVKQLAVVVIFAGLALSLASLLSVSMDLRELSAADGKSVVVGTCDSLTVTKCCTKPEHVKCIDSAIFFCLPEPNTTCGDYGAGYQVTDECVAAHCQSSAKTGGCEALPANFVVDRCVLSGNTVDCEDFTEYCEYTVIFNVTISSCRCNTTNTVLCPGQPDPFCP
jgi:hypothetical protein